MGKQDTITKKYLSNPVIFADAFNKYLYHGKQFIKPESLRELDSKEIVLPFRHGQKKETMQKDRDVVKVVMTDDKHAYCIMGVENQSNIHYAMPVRNGLYDFIRLSKQVGEIAEKNRTLNREKSVENADLVDGCKEKPTSDEFLSGFMKNDCVLPVITLVIYWGPEEWDGPMTLKEMYSDADETILAMAPDYKINLLSPAQINENEIKEFHSSLRQVLKYIKYSEDKQKLKKLAQCDDEFRAVERVAVDVINAVTNSNIEILEGEEVVDMCKGLVDWAEESREEGRIEERKENIAKCISIFRKRNISDEIIIEDLMEEFKLTADEAKAALRK